MASTSSTPTLWDVFLSFRGIDTRYTFTDHLYKDLHKTKKIQTFMDEPGLRSGEVISDSLIQAIQESKTYIVVLSENYASSSWCLDELVEILDCSRRMKRLIVPVFYNIDPSIVRHQTGSFKEAFEIHQTRFEMDKVNKWRHSLKEVADFSGFHISKTRSQVGVIDEVVDRISLEINPKTLYVAKYPVGLDSRVKEITALLNSDTRGVIRIGIHGMGGVGKTTLAKAVYNQNYQRFQGSCFLANVRELSGTENGLVGLQHQLIVDVLKCNNFNIGNKDQGIELIRARICSTKVLIVIDDLDNPKPLEYLEGSFGLGSMMIITTRNEDLLDSIKVQSRFKANVLDDDESHQLFVHHAFGENKIPHTFTAMSKEILKRAGGLPLALMVFGSNLLNRSEEDWRWFIDKLSRVPNDDIEKKLMISFDALKSVDPILQDIFLDIACFYIGWRKEKAAKILGSCYTFVNRNIDYLIKRCLLTINKRDELQMHDLLRDMGRTIACNNSPDEPEKHSRLWVSQDIHSVLKKKKKKKGTEVIQGIMLRYHCYSNGLDEGVSYAAETFKRMSKLRFLYLNGVNLTGSFEHTFEDLRWFCWKHCPLKCLPSDFCAQKLVTLALPYSRIRTMWELNMDPPVFDNLKTLNMSNSQHLTTTPDFTRLPYLETLDLKYCRSLEEVHISIGSLVRLVYLNLYGCSKLRSIPDSICSLKALEVLVITYCINLEALPTEFGNIESLKVLEASELSVSKLPDSIGRLSNLVELCLTGNKNLETLPDIRQLSKLKLSRCYHLLSIVELPPNLKWIDAVACGSMQRLPNLSNLKQLERLDLRKCNALTEIQGLGELTSLEYLDLGDCRFVERLPNLSILKQLKWLFLRNCNALTEIQGLGELTSLKWIDAADCGSMERLPTLSNLKQLERLDLGKCNTLTEIQGLGELTSLEYLHLGDCRSMERLPNISNLKQLKGLDIHYCNGLTEIQGLEELASLQVLNLVGCNSSLVAYTLTERFFQIFSGFGHKIQICIRSTENPDWISQSSECVSRMSLDLQPNASHDFLAIILVFKNSSFFEYTFSFDYSVLNITSGFDWSDTVEFDLFNRDLEEPSVIEPSVIVVVPSSIFSITNGDDRIELTSEEENILGIYLLYKTDDKRA